MATRINIIVIELNADVSTGLYHAFVACNLTQILADGSSCRCRVAGSKLRLFLFEINPFACETLHNLSDSKDTFY